MSPNVSNPALPSAASISEEKVSMVTLQDAEWRAWDKPYVCGINQVI